MRSFTLVALVACGVFGGAIAFGDEIAVCGTAVTPFSGVAIQGFESGTKAQVAPNFVALESLLQKDGGSWPSDMRGNIAWALSGLEHGNLPSKAFDITKSGGLTPTQDAFSGTGHEVILPIDKSGECSQNPNGVRDAAVFILLVQKVLADAAQHRIALTATQLDVLEKEYDKYLFEGFPMFPWEAAVNSWFLTPETIAQGPPRNMLVLLHPAAGVVGSVSSGSRSDIGGSLSIEPVGWIHYSSDYQKWYGASLLTVFATDRNVGYGVALNYRNYKLGVVWVSDRGSSHNGATLFLGIDLLQFVNKEQRTYGGYLDKAKQVFSQAQ